MAKTIAPDMLGAVIAKELTLYHKDVIERVNAAGAKAAKNLVKRTKATAPKDSGDFADHITYKAVSKTGGDKMFIWGASAPEHRKTHLLVHGHATVNGGRVAGNSFLTDAMEVVLPEYEEDVEEAMIP